MKVKISVNLLLRDVVLRVLEKLRAVRVDAVLNTLSQSMSAAAGLL